MKELTNDKVLVAISGGKESIVTAWLLKKQGMKLRGIFFDTLGDENLAQAIVEFERKLGISIQIVNVKTEAEKFLFDTLSNAITVGQRLNLKAVFHQKFLFPKLFEFQTQYQFTKVATGHRALVQNDSIENVMKVHRYTAIENDESPYLLGLNQKQLSDLIVPLGGIPASMIDKIATELNVTNEAHRFDLDFNEMLGRARKSLVKDQSRSVEVYNANGKRVGTLADYANLVLGDSFADPDEMSRSYIVTEIDGNRRRVTVNAPERRVIRELHLEDAAWFSRDDLGLQSTRCAMAWNNHLKVVPVRLIQYEGARMKAFIETPLVGGDADIFNGQTVLWVTGAEVLGGARVTSCKE